MPTTTEQQRTLQTLDIKKDVLINAPIDVVFETLLEPTGPLGDMGLKIEPWPGGRWYRDLGNNTGHWWGHVQVIKPPTLLEITGPIAMSYAAVNHLQYRLTERGGGTRLTLQHRAMGEILPEHRDGMPKGWEYILGKIRERAERKKAAPPGGRK